MPQQQKSSLDNNKENKEKIKSTSSQAKPAPVQPPFRRFKMKTIFGEQLSERQKLRKLFNIKTENQLRLTFEKARKLKGDTGLNLLILLESRLDNLVYRLGFASTRKGARQLVSHGHILVNNKRVDIPSYFVQVNDQITLDKGTKDNQKVKESLKKAPKILPFLNLDKDKLIGTYARTPYKNELEDEVNILLVVRHYI